MRHAAFLTLLCLATLTAAAQKQEYKFDMGQDARPLFFSVKIPDGDYRVSVTMGSPVEDAVTAVRGESRRLLLENVSTKKGEYVTQSFTVNKRDKYIRSASGEIVDSVRIKPRERFKANWDGYLTLEFNGASPAVTSLNIEPVKDAVTVFLCGNSTVVDQDNEPWASWGQMIPRFFDDRVCFANYAESGESSNTFIAAKRLEKLLTQMKAGDYIFIEFGHNDEKQKGEDKGAYKHFTQSLKVYIDEARKRGAHPVLLTPTERRSFDADGRPAPTHGEFPQAVKDLAAKENVPVIDLTAMVSQLYLALGPEGSKKSLVHYPAGTFPGQKADFADNTHYNTYGAYQIAKCVIEGMKLSNLPLLQYLRPDYVSYNPAHSDSPEAFDWPLSPFVEIEKPDGN